MDINLDDITGTGSSVWMQSAACLQARTPQGDPVTLDDYFVSAGHIIDPAVLDICHACPVRRECLQYAYSRDLTAGYFGGMSPGQRRKLTADEALAVLDSEQAG